MCSFSQKESYFSPFGSSFKVLWAIVRTLSDKKCEKILTEEEEEEEEEDKEEEEEEEDCSHIKCRWRRKKKRQRALCDVRTFSSSTKSLVVRHRGETKREQSSGRRRKNAPLMN